MNAPKNVPKLPQEWHDDVGARLRAYRKRFYTTQHELADKLGISRSLLNLYELAERALPVAIAVRLGQLENVSLDAIYLGIQRTPRDQLIADKSSKETSQ